MFTYIEDHFFVFLKLKTNILQHKNLKKIIIKQNNMYLYFLILTLIMILYNLTQVLTHRHHVHYNSSLRSINIHIYFCDHNNYV